MTTLLGVLQDLAAKVGVIERTQVTPPVWATVTQVSPLRIQLDTDTAPLTITPENLAGTQTVGNRVLVNVFGKRAIVYGPVTVQTNTYLVSGNIGDVVACMAAVGDAAPAGCLWLDEGGVGNRTAHAGLFAKWGTRFGAGDGSTTFGLIDMRGKVLAGKAAAGTFNAAIGATVGTETHTHGTSTLVAAIYVGYWKVRNAVANWTATNSGGLTAPGGNTTTSNSSAAVEGTTDAGSSVQPTLIGRFYTRYQDVTLAPAGSTASITPLAGTVALRDANGNAQGGTPVAGADWANKTYADAVAGWAANNAWAASRVPAFHVWKNGSFNSSGAEHNIAMDFDQVRVNQGGGWNTTTKKFTAPVAGLYEFTLSICNTADTVGPEGGLYKNNVSYVYMSIAYKMYVPATQTIQMVLAAGDVIHPVLRNNNAVTIAVDGTRSYFAGKLLSLT